MVESDSSCSSGPEAEQLVADFVDEPLALDRRERGLLLREQALGETRHLGVELLRVELAELAQVHPVDERAVQPRLHLLERLLAGQRVVALGDAVRAVLADESFTKRHDDCFPDPL